MDAQPLLNFATGLAGLVGFGCATFLANKEYGSFRQRQYSVWGAFWWVVAWTYGLLALLPMALLGYADWIAIPFTTQGQGKPPILTAEMIKIAVKPVMWFYGIAAGLAIGGAIVFALWLAFLAALRSIAREIAAGTAEGHARKRDDKGE